MNVIDIVKFTIKETFKFVKSFYAFPFADAHKDYFDVPE